MRILFISTVPVFPPSDGVRIPPANYVKGLSQTHEVHFLLLSDAAGMAPNEADVRATTERVQQFDQVAIERGSKAVGITREIFGIGPYFGYWNLCEAVPDRLASTEYDAIFTCTQIATGIFASEQRQRQFGGDPKWVAAVSDLHSLAIARLAENASKNHKLITRSLQRYMFVVRSYLLCKSELKMLACYDYHLVQTDKELEWVKKKERVSLSERSVILPNAVDDKLFELPTARTGKRIAFVGVLAALYAGRFEWFIHQVWNQVHPSDESLTLTAVGRGASPSLQETMQSHDIEYIDFVERLEDIYRDHDFLIAPIFKGYGLINKVVEAMTAGCLVIGDATAFNGIPDFVPGEHGLIANSAADFVRVLTEEVNDTERTNQIRAAARALMEKHFRWSQRIDVLNSKVLSTSD